MSNLDENMEWQSEFQHLAKLSKSNPYRVPENYFENLSSQIGNKIFLENFKTENRVSFTVPEKYFQDLSENIFGAIAAENLHESKLKDGFSTPENYFDTLTKTIHSKTVGITVQPKLIKLWQNNLFKYATAACLVILTGSGVYYNGYRSEQQKLAAAEFATENMLYDIDENVIREHIQEGNTSITNAASNAEMESYILSNLSSYDITNNF